MQILHCSAFQDETLFKEIASRSLEDKAHLESFVVLIKLFYNSHITRSITDLLLEGFTFGSSGIGGEQPEYQDIAHKILCANRIR